MSKVNRRRFVAVSSVAATSAVLVACGNKLPSEEQLNPTQIPDVPGAPPTLAPITEQPGAGSTTETPGTDAGTTTPGAVTIEAHDDFTFSPKEVDVAPGQTVTLVNAGFMQHDLVCDDLGVGTELLNGGESGTFTIPEDATVGETYDFHCSVPGHAQSGMVGTFNIVEAGAASEETETEEEATEESAGGDEAGAAGEITIEAHDDFTFSPKDVDVAPGQTVTLVNAGFMQHDLVCDDLGVGTELLNGGESGSITIPDDATVGETYDFHCSVPGHAQSGMVGTFTIVEAGAAVPAAETTDEVAEEPAEGDSDEAAAGTTGEAITIEAHDDFSFDPQDVDVTPGQTIILVNAGFMQHDIAVDDWSDEPMTPLLNAGEEHEFTVPADAQVGETYEYYCTVPGHKQSGMAGTFTIIDGGVGGAASAETEEEEAPAEESTPEAEATPEGEASLEPITIEALDSFAFEPKDVEAAPGQTIILVNGGFMQHDIAVDDWSDEPMTPLLNAAEEFEFTIPEDATVGETYDYYCTVPGHKQSGMVGTFTIVEAPAGGDSGSSAGGKVIEVHMLDSFAYDPDVIEVSVGDTLHFVNKGFMQHDAAVDEWSDDPLTPLLNAGEEADVVIPDAAEAGKEYAFYCTVPGHRQSGMEGVLKIV